MAECYICGSNSFVDNHHYDCQGGKVNPETVPLCRRCHRTYHDFGVEWFDDGSILDRAIEVENRKREIYGQPLMSQQDIRRSDYWYKKHGIGWRKPRQLAFTLDIQPGAITRMNEPRLL